MSLDFQKRCAIEKIMGQVIGEEFSLEQLDIILHTCMALTWSEETMNVARAAYGLTKEIIHRDQAQWSEPKPWENLLPQFTPGDEDRAVAHA
jgi:hypothetical protein